MRRAQPVTLTAEQQGQLERYANGRRVAVRLALRSRIILLASDVHTALSQFLRDAGCYCEYGEFPGLSALAVSVPTSTRYSEVVARLEALERRELISYAELRTYSSPQRTG